MSEIINKTAYVPVLPRTIRKREQIIDIGSRLIFKQGYHGTSIKHIVDAVGMQKGSFYNYFPSKEEFIIEALEHHFEGHIIALTVELKNSTGSTVERIVELCRKTLGQYSSDEFSPFSFKIKVCAELKISHPEIEEVVNHSTLFMRDAIAECLLEGQERGETGKDINVKIIADYILYAWKGFILHADTFGNKNALAEFITVLEQRILVQIE